MAINVFAGARRIAVVAAVGIVGTGGMIGLNESAYLYHRFALVYEETAQGTRGTLLESTGWCDNRRRSIERSLETPRGRRVSVTVCAAEGNAIMRDIDDAEVDRLLPIATRAVDLEAMDRDADRQLREHWKTDALGTLGALVALAVLTLVVGWIVRGFLGIPWRQDRRSPAAAPGTSEQQPGATPT